MQETQLGNFVTCDECAFFNECENCETRDGCFHGEVEQYTPVNATGDIGERGPMGITTQPHICLNCRKVTNATNHLELRTVLIKNTPIEYWHLTWICDECGQEVWDEDADDYNAEEPWRIYNKRYK